MASVDLMSPAGAEGSGGGEPPMLALAAVASAAMSAAAVGMGDRMTTSIGLLGATAPPILRHSPPKRHSLGGAVGPPPGLPVLAHGNDHPQDLRRTDDDEPGDGEPVGNDGRECVEDEAAEHAK